MEELASLGFISVIPAILAIVLSFATKNTIVALAIACITGTTLTGLAPVSYTHLTLPPIA